MASSEILAKIGLNSAGFKTGLAQCKLAANSFKSSVGGMFKNLGGQVLGMLGVSAGIAGLGALAKQTIDLGGHIEDMARNLRMGKSEFQTLAYTAKLAGMEESRLVMTMNNLNLRTIEACDGNKSYQESFKRLGISLGRLKLATAIKVIRSLLSVLEYHYKSLQRFPQTRRSSLWGTPIKSREKVSPH